MCMANSTARFAPILTSRQRRHPVELPEDPTEEELARDWALSAGSFSPTRVNFALGITRRS